MSNGDEGTEEQEAAEAEEREEEETEENEKKSKDEKEKERKEREEARINRRIEDSRRALIYHIMRADRKTGEPVGIDPSIVRVTMKADLPDLATGTEQQLGWWDLQVKNKDRGDKQVRKDHFHPFDPLVDDLHLFLDSTIPAYQEKDGTAGKKAAEVKFYQDLRPELKGKWVMRVIGWNSENHSYEEKGIELWSTTPNAHMPDGTTTVNAVMRKYRTPTFEPVWIPTWAVQNELYASLGISKKYPRFTSESSDAFHDPHDPVPGRILTVPNSLISMVSFGLLEWARNRQLWLTDRNALYARFDQYSEEDWQFWWQFSGGQKATKQLDASREHPDKTKLFEFLDRYEWSASQISDSVLLAIRDLIETEKVQREKRVSANPRLGDLSVDHKAALAARITGYVVNSRTPWVKWAYWFMRAGQGFAPDINEPVTHVTCDKTDIAGTSVVFNTWGVFRDEYLEQVPGYTGPRDANGTPTTPEGWRPRRVPEVGTPAMIYEEDGMRIKFQHRLWELIVDRQTIIYLEDEERDGTLTVKTVDQAFDLKGNFRLAEHWLVTGREAERNALYAQWVARASNVELQPLQERLNRETLTWEDVNKAFTAGPGGLFWRDPTTQARVRQQWLDAVDAVWANFFTNPLTGLVSIGSFTRSKVMDQFEKGFTKHDPARSPWGHRVKIQPYLRLADRQDALKSMVESIGGGARVMKPESDIKFGAGIDPDERCVGPISQRRVGERVEYSYARVRFDGHSHGSTDVDQIFCEAKHPGESLERHYQRVRWMRVIGRILLGWFNKITDNENWMNDFYAALPDKVQNTEQYLEAQKDAIKSGNARSRLILPYTEWMHGADREMAARSFVEAKFRAMTDVSLITVTKEDGDLVAQAGDDVFIDMWLGVASALTALRQSGKLKFNGESLQDLQLKTQDFCKEYWEAYPWSRACLERECKKLFG